MVEVVASSETATVVVSTWVIRFGVPASHVSVRRTVSPLHTSVPLLA